MPASLDGASQTRRHHDTGTHGLQLSREEKRDREAKKQELQRILSVSDRTLREWFSRIDKDTKEARNKRIVELWLACHTQEEIAETVGCTRDEVRAATEKFGEYGKSAEIPKDIHAAAQHMTDFTPPESQR